jgi:hypothetical protein
MVFRGMVFRGNVVRGNVVRGNVVRGTDIEPYIQSSRRAVRSVAVVRNSSGDVVLEAGLIKRHLCTQAAKIGPIFAVRPTESESFLP